MMSDDKSGGSVNTGGTREASADTAADFDIARDASERGDKLSPSDRERGETTGAEPAAPIDMDTAHDRAS